MGKQPANTDMPKFVEETYWRDSIVNEYLTGTSTTTTLYLKLLIPPLAALRFHFPEIALSVAHIAIRRAKVADTTT
jgi:hypothetical protein